MRKLNKTEKLAIEKMVKEGFTFTGDNFTNTFTKAKRALNYLLKNGYCRKSGDAYEPLQPSYDFVKYGIENCYKRSVN